MSKEIRIKRHDYNRVVLTEVQPYELPLIITNEGYYRVLNSNARNDFLFKIFHKYKITKPYDFKIIKLGSTYRTLSLIHPYGQYKFVDFYRKNHNFIRHRCKTSKYSLRYPMDIALYYYESDADIIESKYKDEGVDLVIGESIEVPAYASSFFSYKDYNFLYKFYDSYQFHRIEKKYRNLHKFDISKCFESMSIDMLSAAWRGEDNHRTSAECIGDFESSYSSLMSYVNYGRVHGVVIGPEFSRVYSELLLQKIDNKILKSLSKIEVEFGVDYQIKRYVDDYFLFYNDDITLEKIKPIVIDELAKFKLFTNESKDEFVQRPFITGVTNAKLQIKGYFDDLFSHVKIDTNGNKIEINSAFLKYSKLANGYITKIKSIMDTHKVSYESITGYFFTILRRKVSEINAIYESGAEIERQDTEKLARFILILNDLMFFVYSMDCRVRATFLVSEIILQISELCKHFDYDMEVMISDKIMQEAKLSMKNIVKTGDQVEGLNLGLALLKLNTENSISQEDIKDILGFKDKNHKPNYFNLVVGLFMVKKNPAYRNLKDLIIRKTDLKLRTVNNILMDSEATHLLFDFVSCPHVNKDRKITLLNNLMQVGALPKIYSSEDWYQNLSSHQWFVDWGEISIKRLLKKKQLRSAY